MLPKKNRADKKAIDTIFKKGSVLNTANLSFRFVLNTEEEQTPPKISFIAPKTVSKLAVKRNLLRRRGYQALKIHLSKFPAGLTGAFVFKKTVSSVSELENEIQSIVTKLK